MARIMSKEELRAKLEKLEKLSHHKTGKPKNYAREYKYASIAKAFLRDYSKFKDYFDTIDADITFIVISSRIMNIYRKKHIHTILFDSHSIVLMQLNNTLFIYLIAEYMVK